MDAHGLPLTVPTGSRLLQRPLLKGGESREVLVQHVWGVHWTEEEFTHEAARLGHPKSFLRALPEELREAVNKNIRSQPWELALERAHWFKHWISRAKELKLEEWKLRQQLDTCARKVMEGK